MYTIGTINKEVYSCVTRDIVSPEVVITERQIQHIRERHPSDFERFSVYLKEIVEEPDFILKANKPFTALILKEISVSGETFQLVLRLQTSSDPVGYKNSIITFFKIEKRKWDKYLRNKEILYSHEDS